MSETLTALILTFNEEQHIARCLRSLSGLTERICVIDSFSTDRTIDIARALGAEVVQHPWPGHAAQLQWGLDTLGITSDWTLRIDADEYLDDGLRQALAAWLRAPEPGITGLFLRRQIVFLGRPIRHGFFYPLHILRLWRSGLGRMEPRRMDEHVVLSAPGCKVLSGGDLVDHNLNDLSWWIAKHNGYATLEVAARIDAAAAPAGTLSGPPGRKRWLKEHLYTRLPPTLRSGLYFLYRYGLGRGFLDGKEGFFFHVLQAFWYRTLVEAKLFELEQRASAAGLSPRELLARDGLLPAITPSDHGPGV